jgi:hypothetical protein
MDRYWTLIEALAYASALTDPTGGLAAQRFAHAREQARQGAERRTIQARR